MRPFSIFEKIFKKEKPQEENYLSLTVTPDRILANIWTFEGESIRQLGFGRKIFQNTDVLVHQAAIAIDNAGKQAKADITDVVFGLSQYYLEDSSLSEATTKMLKKLSQELELDPQAFVSLPASINHYLKIEENVTPNVVIVGIFGNFCEAHLLDEDKVANTKSFKGSVNTLKIKNLLTDLKQENKNLPSKIVLYGIEENSSLAKEISKNDWKELFIHEPKIDFIDDKELSKSVSYAQAADVLGHDPDNKTEENNVEMTQNINKVSQKPEQEPKPEPKPEQEPEPVEENLGFVEGEDILLSEKESKAQATQPEKEQKNISNVVTPQSFPQIQSQQNNEYAISTKDQNVIAHEQKPKSSKKFNFSFFKLPNIFKKRPGKKVLIAIGVFLIVALVAVFAAGQVLTKAQVVIKVNAQSFENEFNVEALQDASLDVEESRIGAKLVSGTASGNQKAVTTGSKTIGEPAKGEVTIFNWTSSGREFQEGTTIITKNGLKFTLDEQIEATSASAPSGSDPGSPGKANIKITATEVGTDHNLDPGQDFTFTEFDEFSYSAQNDGAITGGSEKQITVATQEDMDRLESSLLKTLTEKAIEDLKSKSTDKTIQEDAISINIASKNFDKDLDEEASLITLDMEIEASVLVYSEEDLKKLLAEKFKDDTEENLALKQENIQIKSIIATAEEESLILEGEFKANLIPKFDEEELKNSIKGKSVKETRAKIKELPAVSDVSVNFSPNIRLLGTIPGSSDKITFKIETN